ncbi:MAG: 23S rRNA (guanosine(2251)-2'-O)-methyltransferase RlmB [Anaerolineaceae bacterium]|nr:23S rRNA (guanosine(2251)-2'-O)-methyltransferase RlmB [Anaerolineaceae bacterium]
MKEWITGRNPVYETLQARRRASFRLRVAEGAEVKGRMVDILKLCETRHVLLERVPRARLDSLSESHQGVALETSGYPYAALQDILLEAANRQEPLFILALDALQNPQNLGVLLRTAEAVGVQGVVIPLARTAEVTPAVVQASSGASEHLLIARANLAQSLETLKEAGAWIVGLEGSPEAVPVEQAPLDGALVLVVGSEGEGLRALVRKSCDLLVRLPMRGRVESLNAAVAGSVILYLALRARARRS